MECPKCSKDDYATGATTWDYDNEGNRKDWLLDSNREWQDITGWYEGTSRGGNTVYSPVNLWEGLSEDYNSQTGYNYTTEELKLRYQLITEFKDNPVTRHLVSQEKAGMAEPITKEEYEKMYGDMADFHTWQLFFGMVAELHDGGRAIKTFRSKSLFRNNQNIVFNNGGGSPPNQVSNIIGKRLRKQKQANSHTLGGSRLGTKSYLNTTMDAQQVIDATHNGQAIILHKNRLQNRVYVEYDGVEGYYNNRGTIVPTNKFLIKGGGTSTVVPVHPNKATFF